MLLYLFFGEQVLVRFRIRLDRLSDSADIIGFADRFFEIPNRSYNFKLPSLATQMTVYVL
jgi:hypothetical protein